MWGNTYEDFHSASSSSILVNNDYLALGGNNNSSTGYQTVDPQFVSGSDFHLSATSPLLAAGTLTPSGNLPTIDIEGHSRTYSATTNTVDMGAYEHGDEIFNDDYDR
jgi:hypothetical protein